MRKLIPPFVLFLIGIGYWYYDSFTTDISGGTDSSKDKKTDDKPLPKKSVERRDATDKKIPDDPFPLRYLADWKTDEGPMILMQVPDTRFVKGIYYYEDPMRQKGRIATTYIQKNNRKILSGYWIQSKSLKKCDFEKYGTYYWGRLAFEFKGDSFVGLWGYCDDKPKASWNGRRV